MPHALSDLQRDYLNFIKDYIRENEKSPRLEEIVEHFGVKPPTAHKMLKKLRRKGFLIFDRTSASGFFIRLIERGGAQEVVMNVPLVGKVSELGEVYDFPEPLGEFPTVLAGAKPEEVFALALTDDIPQASMEKNDFIIFDIGKKPQPGDICICLLRERYFLMRIARKTFDDHFLSYEGSQDYPFPDALSDPERKQRFHYDPLAYTEENEEAFLKIMDDEGISYFPFPEFFIHGTALRLTRALTY
jgi:SOS-response transcriptional repressor LexA